MMRKVLYAALLVSGTALACTVIDGVSFSATVRANSLTEVGEDLQEQFGSTWGRDHDVQGYVLVLPRYVNLGGTTIPFHKPCDQTFEERGAELDPLNDDEGDEGDGDGDSSGGGGGGGGYLPPMLPPPGCYGDCGGTVTVGELDPV